MKNGEWSSYCWREVMKTILPFSWQSSVTWGPTVDDPPPIDPNLGVENGWPVGYFAETTGVFAGEPFERANQGVALTHDLTVVTGNIKGFSRVPSLKLEDWSANGS